jgi:tetratricopeptide (TPR) repeat protein
MLEPALEMALGADEGRAGDGSVLFNLANQTVEEYKRLEMPDKTAYFDLGLRALDAFLEGYPGSPQVPRAKLMLIDLLVDLAAGRVKGHAALPLEAATTRSLEALDWLITSFPGTDYAEQAYMRKGDVVFRIQGDPERALEIYKEGMRNARFFRSSFAERLGRVYLIIERYDEANAHFLTLVGSGNQELRETGIFYSGLLLGFTGNYEMARDTLTGLAETNPSSQFANDAIELAWAIEEGLKGQQGPLKSYIVALRADLAQDTTQVTTELGKIVALGGDEPLRPRSLIKLGEVYEGLGDNDRAVQVLETFIADYPRHQQLPDVHRRIARIYEVGYQRIDVALDKYEDILLLFPHYMFLDEIRKDVSRLRDRMGEN